MFFEIDFLQNFFFLTDLSLNYRRLALFVLIFQSSDRTYFLPFLECHHFCLILQPFTFIVAKESLEINGFGTNGRYFVEFFFLFLNELMLQNFFGFLSLLFDKGQQFCIIKQVLLIKLFDFFPPSSKCGLKKIWEFLRQRNLFSWSKHELRDSKRAFYKGKDENVSLFLFWELAQKNHKCK